MMTYWENKEPNLMWETLHSLPIQHHVMPDQSLHKGDDKQKMKVGIEKETPVSARKIGKSTFSSFILTKRLPEGHRNEAV